MATIKDALVVGITFGLIVGSAGYATRAFYRLRSTSDLAAAERRRARLGAIAGGVLAALGSGFVVVALLLPQDISELQKGLFQGCQQRCVTDGGEALICDRYCTCYVRELTAVHGPRGPKQLIVAVSRENDASAIAKLAEQAQKCAAQM